MDAATGSRAAARADRDRKPSNARHDPATAGEPFFCHVRDRIPAFGVCGGSAAAGGAAKVDNLAPLAWFAHYRSDEAGKKE